MPVQVQRGGTGIAPTHLQSMLEWGGQHHALAASPQRRPGTIHIEGWVGLGGLVWNGMENLLSTGI